MIRTLDAERQNLPLNYFVQIKFQEIIVIYIDTSNSVFNKLFEYLH